MPIAGRQIFKLLVVASSTALVGFGCKPSTGQRPTRDKIVRIVVIGEGQDEPTWPVIQATAEQFARKYALTVVETRAPLTSSPHDQQELLKALPNERFDAVCVHPTDPSTIGAEVNLLAQRGLSVVTIGRDIQPSQRQAYCGPSEFELGKSTVQAATKILEQRNKTLMLLHAGTEDEDYSKRYYGFKQGMSQTGGLEVLREVNCRGNPIDAVRLVKAESRMYPRVGSWVFLDDWPLRALRRDEPLLPLGGTIVLCNGSPRYFDHVRDGRVQAMVAYDYQKALEEGLFAAVRLVEDRSGGFAPVTDLAPEIITIRELPSYEARWKRWQRGEATLATKP